jgi:cardiolipin synthase
MAKRIPYGSASHVELVKSGNDFFEKANRIIRNSKHKIHLQTYIFADDSTGLETIKHLAEAVKRGVEVYLLIDSFGSHELKLKTIKSIKENGINFRKYSPLFSGPRIRFGRRLHHKILISDEKEALIGGINFDNNYHLAGKDSPWLDYAVYVTGTICVEIDSMCERLWSGKGYFRRRKRRSSVHKNENHHHPIPVKLQQNDWLYGKKGISRSINNSIRHAQSSVTLVESYFLPGSRMRRSLKSAAKRNVKVKIILPGLSDVKLVKNAMSYWYAWLLRNNIELYEWNKTILHGKLIAVDNNWVNIGSYNINHLSHFSSIETNLEVKDEHFCGKVNLELADVMSKCKIITSDENKKRANPFEMFIWWSSFQLVRFLFLLQFKILSKE